MNRLVLLVLMVSLVGPVVAQDLSPQKQTALDATEALSPDIRAMAMSLWTYSETALLETQSAELLAGILEEEGFMASPFIKSPLGYRAGFEKINGRWRMRFFLAGD